MIIPPNLESATKSSAQQITRGKRKSGSVIDAQSEEFMPAASIHIGIGGWDYDPWRGTFYPPGLARTKQLDYAGRCLTAIEINATHYKLQSPELFRRWR